MMSQNFLNIFEYLKYISINFFIEFTFSHDRFLVRQELIKKIVEFQNGVDILDVGAGDSRYSDIFKDHNYKTQDICIDKNFSYRKIDFNCDLDSLIHKNMKFDFIICTFVLEHVFEYEEFINKLSMLTRKNGHIFITTNFCYLEHANPNDFFRFSRYAFHKIIENHFEELKIIECRPLDKIFTFMLNFMLQLPFYFLGDKSPFAKMILIIFSPFIIIIRILVKFLDIFDKRNKLYTVIYLYLEKSF